jgi:hypothetical protein
MRTFNHYKSVEGMVREVSEELCPGGTDAWTQEQINDLIHGWAQNLVAMESEDTDLTIQGDRQYTFSDIFSALEYINEWGAQAVINSGSGEIDSYELANYINIRYWQDPITSSYYYEVYVDNES